MLLGGVGRVRHYGLQITDCQVALGGHISGVDSLSNLANSDPGADPLIGTICDGTYEIIARVGKGGMGSVYRAHHRHLERDAAVKILRGQSSHNPSAVQRFRQEARSLSLLSHPNIVHCYAFGIHEDNCFLAMDFVDGTTLQDEISEHGPLSEERFSKIFHQVLSALSHAHASGIIHRDLKPDNIMLVQEDNQQDIVKLVDFGIAKVAGDIAASGQELTRSGGLVGSPLYMSPEQCSGRALDVRSDLYSLGCVMYFALTGAPPFPEQSLVDAVRSHIEKEPEPLPRNVSGGISNLIEAAMSKAPAERFASADEMDAALNAAAGATTREARRIRHRKRGSAGSLVVRHPRIISAVLVAVSLTALASYKLLHDPATELNTQLKEQEQHYLVDVATTRAAARKNPGLDPSDAQYVALSQSFDRLMQARLKLANYQLSRGEDGHAAAVMSDFIRNDRDFEGTCHNMPYFSSATIRGITDIGRRLIAANQRMSGGPCIVLAINLCRVRLDKNDTSKDERIELLNDMEEAVDSLDSVELEARHLELPGNRHIQLPTRLEGYMYIMRIAFGAEEPLRVQKMATKVVERVEAETPMGNRRLRPEQASRFLHAAIALDSAFRRSEAIEVMNVANRICRLDEPDPDGPAPAAGYYSALYRFETNPHDPQIAVYLNKALKAAAALGVNATQIHLLFANFCQQNHDRPGVYRHLREALASRGFSGHMLDEHPRYEEAHFRLGEMLAADGKMSQALSEFTAYKQYIDAEAADHKGDAAYFANYNRLINTCVRLGLSDAAQNYALKSYQRGCAANDLEQQAHQSQALSIIAMSKQDYPSALKWVNTAISASEKVDMVPWARGAYYANRSSIALAQNEPQKAYDDACRAEQLIVPSMAQFPNGELRAFEVLYTYNKGAAAFKLNKLVEAEALLRQCIRACGRIPEWEPRRISAARELCKVLNALGKHEQARNVAQRQKL